MEGFEPLRLDSGTANRDKNAKKRQIDEVVQESTITARPFFKKRRFYPPWNLPSIHRFDSPEHAISKNDLFIHEIKWDDKTTGVHTLDVLCDTLFFGHDIGKNLKQGEFLLLYTGPQNLRNTLINAKLQRSENVLPSGGTDSNSSKLKRVVPLSKLLQLITECVKVQRDYFDHRHVDMTFAEYVNQVTKKFELGGIVSLMSRMRTPDDMWRYFKPLGFLHSIDGKPDYEGSSYPLVSVQHWGLKYTSHLNGRFAPKGCHLYYVVGMTNMYRREELLGRNPVFNYPRPLLVYSADDRPSNLVRQFGFVGVDREHCATPCLLKYVGNFVTDYRPSSSNMARAPYLQIDMLREPFSVYV